MHRPRVYLSGPITKGNRSWNLYQALEAHRLLLQAGYAVLNPMLTMLHPDEKAIPHHVWLESDFAFIRACELLIRLPGESVGADAEVEFALHECAGTISVVVLRETGTLEHLVEWIMANPAADFIASQYSHSEPN